MNFCSCLVVCCILYLTSVGSNELDGQIDLQIYHSLELGDVPVYDPRGYINIHSIKNGQGTYFQDYALSSEDISRLKKLAQSNGWYRVKLVVNSDDDKSLYSFTKACTIYESGLSDEVTITLDQTGNPVGIAVSATPSHCFGATVPDSSLTTFNTTVTIVNLVTAPVPDIVTYIQRLEQEKAEKARGEQGDNRSFLSKYWMYIVPIVIFLFISGASSPEGQGAGR